MGAVGYRACATDEGSAMGALLALISSLSWGVADFIGGLAARRAGTVQVLAVSYPAGAVVLTLVAIFVIPGNLTPAVIPYALIAGSIGALAIGLLYAALTRGPMGVVSPITAVMSGAVPVVAGVLRGESLSGLAIAGMVLAIFAVVLVSRESGHAHQRTPINALLLAIASGAAIGLYLTAIGLAPSDSGVWVATLGRWVSTVAMVVTLLVVVRSFPRTGFPWKLAVISGILDAAANGIFQLATQRGLLAIVAVIGSLYPAATVMLARIFLQERLNRLQITGVVAALVAAASLALA
ncbi:MAG: DMT family transporter [Actinobacteria bacterium]|nr:DMT family transporter [Actinomycetota bacterium]